MNATTTPNTMIEFSIRGDKRMIELSHSSDHTDARGTVWENWGSLGQIAYAKIGRGTKLWATSLYFWRNQTTGKWHLLTVCINNRNNTTLVGWNDLPASDLRRSQHIAQVGKHI